MENGELRIESFRHIAIFVVLALMLVSCKETPTDVHSVHPDFEEYVQRFFAYAESYGVPIEDKNIIMQFSNSLASGKAGVCHMNFKPIKIEINEGYWITFSGSPIEDEIKEDLIFHEMGHGFLRRYHDNTELQNGDWKTVMLGDALPHGRASNINYRGMRKDYYIKELFTQTTEVPSWSTYVPDFSKLVESEYYHATPDKEKYWSVGNTEKYNARIEDGLYKYTSKSDRTMYAPLLSDDGTSSILDVTGNFYYEVEAKISSTSVADPSGGMGFSNYTNAETSFDPLHFIYGSNKKLIGIGENSCIALFIQLYSELFKPDEFNKFAIRKNGDTLYYYLNDTFIYHNDLRGIPIKGSSFGFTIGSNCELAVKSALIKTSGAPKRAPMAEGIKPEPVELGPNFALTRKSY